MALVNNSNVASLNARRNLDEPADRALAQVDSPRGNMGTIRNPFESTISNPTSLSESLSTTRTRIRDADFAAQAATWNRDQVPPQVSVAISPHAYSLGQLAFNLLR